MKRNLKVYLVSVFILFIFTAIWLYNSYYVSVSYLEILFFIIVLLAVNNLIIYFCSNINITTSMILPVLFPVIALYGPFWTAVIAMIGSSEYDQLKKSNFIWYRFVFNRANIFIAGAAGSIAYNITINYLNTTYNILPFFTAAIIYVFFNHLLVSFILYMTGNNSYSSFFVPILKSMLISYFLGLLLFFTYINYGKILMILIIIMFYIVKDLYNARIKQVDTEITLEHKKEELKYIKMKNLFFRNLSHELKTPLNIIFSSAQMIETQEKNERTLKYTESIKQNSYRLLRIINNLLDISKIDAKSFSLNYKKIDVVKLIKELTMSVKDYIKDKNQIIKFETKLKEKYIICDPDRIERVILNLISNAIKFTSEDDIIITSIYPDKINKFIYISVKDTGIGIKEEKQNIIFKQFQQIDESLAKSYEGSGLGLAIVKSIVDMHEGEIDIKSKYGEGSEFIIKLPVKKDIKQSNKLETQNDMDRIKLELSDL